MSQNRKLLVFVLVISSVLCVSFDVGISCITCSDKCAYSQCYKITSDDYSA
jgi:hypothetical protein